MDTKQREFSFFRRKFFPIYNHEFKKIGPLNLLFFLVTAVYGVLRVMKDSFIVPLKGATLVSTLKLYGVIPFMFVFALVYNTFSKRVGLHTRMYGLLAYFFFFFLLYYFVLRSLVDVEIGNKNQAYWDKLAALPTWELIKKIWPYVLFYIHAEAWGTFVLSVSCWGFVNRITSVQQAARCYATLSIGAAIATILAGAITVTLSEYHEVLFWGIMVAIVLTFSLYYYFANAIDKNPRAYEVPEVPIKKKKKLGTVAAIKAFWNSKQSFSLFLIFALVFSYAMSINLFEAVFKQLQKHVGDQRVANGDYPTREAFMTKFGGYQLMGTGLVSLIFVLFMAASIRSKGWRFNALFVPVVMLIGSLVFFLSFSYREWIAEKLDLSSEMFMGGTLFAIGYICIVTFKSTKYGSFDPAKESAYNLLDHEERVTGKSFVDGVGSRFGKGGGSFIVGTVLGSFLNMKIFDSVPYLGAIIFMLIGFWIWAVMNLGKQYDALEKAEEEREKKQVKSSVSA